MDSKCSLSPPKLDKKQRKNKNTRQTSKQCLTEPSHPPKDNVLRSTEQTLSNAESPPAQDYQQDEIQSKEASALDYLRGLSEEESNQFGSHIAQIDEEIDLLASDRLSPFMGSKKKKKINIAKSNKEKKPIVIPATKSTKDNDRIKDDKTREEVKKRVRSEPSECSRPVKAMQGKSYQFVYPKIWLKGISNKVSFVASLPDDENNYDGRPDDKALQNDFRSPESQGLIPDNSQKLPSVLQIKKLVGRSYSQLLLDMKDNQLEIRTDRQMAPQEQENMNQVLANRIVDKKAFYPREKKLSEGALNPLESPERIILVGKSVSVPKIHPEIERIVENQKSYLKNIGRLKNTRDKSYDFVVDRNQRYKEEGLWRRLSSPDSKSTSTSRQYNNESEVKENLDIKNRNDEFQKDCVKEEKGKSIKYYKRKSKSEMPSQLGENKKETLEDLNVKDQKIIEDMKVNFMFKRKKSLIDIASPEEEVQISQGDRVLTQNFSREGKRETSAENKMPLEKSSKASKLKMHHLTNKKLKEPISAFILPEIQQALRLKLRLKDINSNQRELKPHNPLSRRDSIRETCIKADMQSFGIKIPKFKAILTAVGKNIESERLTSILRSSEREMINERTLQRQNLGRKPV